MTVKTLPIAIIHTDGSCNSVTKIGGWGAVIQTNSQTKEISGFDGYTTSNRMELQAAISSLESLKTKHRVILYSDSTYVIKGMTQWLKNWKNKGYKNIKNPDLWQKLDTLNQSHKISWQWVKGHSGIEGNERADKLAGLARIKIT